MKTLILFMMVAIGTWGLIPSESDSKSKNPAPEIALQTLDGKTVTLSSLRGKVVLVDFWASWCRPCRYEMRHVLKPLYNQYKDKGFEIYSVSIDQNRQQWLQASQMENVAWPNVSDLKGWRSPVAQTYGINKIPSTFLLDKDGNILAVDLRGNSLAQALAKIFG